MGSSDLELSRGSNHLQRVLLQEFYGKNNSGDNLIFEENSPRNNEAKREKNTKKQIDEQLNSFKHKSKKVPPTNRMSSLKIGSLEDMSLS